MCIEIGDAEGLLRSLFCNRHVTEAGNEKQEARSQKARSQKARRTYGSKRESEVAIESR